MTATAMPHAAGSSLDLDAVRAAFPALARTHGGQPVAYFDGPGGTQVPRSVADAMHDYLLHHNANTRWAYPSSAETDAIIDGARAAVADHVEAVQLIERWAGVTIASHPAPAAEPEATPVAASTDGAIDPRELAEATLEQPL